MNKSVVGIIIALLAVGGIGALLLVSNSNQPNPSTQNPASSSHQSAPDTDVNTSPPASTAETVDATEVSIQNFAYNPKSIKVKVGTKVTWTNQDSTRHDVTPDNETDEFKASQLLDKGETYSVTFNTPGTYGYFCSPHPYMKATVEVVE